jgi:nucleotide-binding universal stress UspA family protein
MARTRGRNGKARKATSRILVATDFSPDATRAIEIASRFARDLGGELVLVHVDEPLLELARSNEDLQRRRMANAELERLTRSLGAQGVAARSSLRVGKPAAEIVAAAGEEDATLLVVGTRGRSMAVAALLGGVAYDVIRKAPCPVLTVHAPLEIRRRSHRRRALKSRSPRRRVSSAKRPRAARGARR